MCTKTSAMRGFVRLIVRSLGCFASNIGSPLPRASLAAALNILLRSLDSSA
jgi:hypothetical protein